MYDLMLILVKSLFHNSLIEEKVLLCPQNVIYRRHDFILIHSVEYLSL